MAQVSDKDKFNKAAFIGLGVMGYPMAGHLAEKGFEVTVFNRTQSKAQQWVCGAWRNERSDSGAGSG